MRIANQTWGRDYSGRQVDLPWQVELHVIINQQLFFIYQYQMLYKTGLPNWDNSQH